MQEKEMQTISREEYLAIKKESRIRAVLVGILFVIGGVLFAVMVINSTSYRGYLYTFGATVVGANYASWLPMWQKKKAIEEVHPDWAKLTTRGVKVPQGEAMKRFVVFGGAFLVLVGVFALRYHPVRREPVQKIQIVDNPIQGPTTVPDSSLIEEVQENFRKENRERRNGNQD